MFSWKKEELFNSTAIPCSPSLTCPLFWRFTFNHSYPALLTALINLFFCPSPFCHPSFGQLTSVNTIFFGGSIFVCIKITTEIPLPDCLQYFLRNSIAYYSSITPTLSPRAFLQGWALDRNDFELWYHIPVHLYCSITLILMGKSGFLPIKPLTGIFFWTTFPMFGTAPLE